MFKIVKKRELNPTVTEMVIEAPLIAKKAKAGQFIIIRAKEDSERIPLTIAHYDAAAGTVAIIFQIVGAGTMQLNSLKEGEYVHDFVGPLGKATEIEGLKNVCVVGGGVGCAIALPVAQALKAQGKKALIPFITAGDPDATQTVPLMQALVAGGADIIELGVPFSDPMADGPTIQRASERALQRGMTLNKVLALVAEFRQHNQQTPVVLMGYLNPLEAMGYAEFAAAAQAAGVDGVLTVDCPPEEADELAPALQAQGLAPVFLVAPTTPLARVQALAKHAQGYVYYVSLKGVTGAATLDPQAVAQRVNELKTLIPLPIGVGFGIRDAASARAIGEAADAVVIGSRLVEEIERSGAQAAHNLTEFLSGIRAALDA